MTLIDLFSGCGGMRYAVNDYFQGCLLTSEIDKFAKFTYTANFGETRFLDIRQTFWNSIQTKYIKDKLPPEVDLMIGGFPCQPFSIAGKRDGLANAKNGDLIFEVLRLAKIFRPKAILLENVANFVKINFGETLRRVIEEFANAGYSVKYKLLNAKDFGLAQNRLRVFFVMFRKDLEINNFEFPVPTFSSAKLADFLEENVERKYYLSDKLKIALQAHKERHQQKGNGFGYKLLSKDAEITNTLSSRYGKDGSEILIYQYRRGSIRQAKEIVPTLTANMRMGGHNVPIITSSDIEVRKLTPRECARLQGFPDSFKFPVSDTQAYKQIGNSVAIPVVNAIGRNIYKSLRSVKEKANA
ncbi:MAG: DNA cytosine methyltransferase [Alphaproteobacteria bacterium]|nr:DNA cytosine methyltransferase [Alphaproteobacteria bacterium]